MAKANMNKGATAPNRQPQSMQQQNTAAPKPQQATPDHEQISRRAYELFLARGGVHGHHEQDWQQAERELRLGKQ
jgi:hypothetical protein